MTSPNPKKDPAPHSNTEKNPDHWTTGDEPMTGAQASYLQTLCEGRGRLSPLISRRPMRRSASMSCGIRLAAERGDNLPNCDRGCLSAVFPAS